VVLGSVWAAVPKGRPSPQTEAELADVAGFVALHMLRQRLTSDVRRGLERQLVGSLLDGGALAADAAARLGLATAAGFRVVALEPRDPAAGEAEQLAARCRDNIAVHLAAPHRGARSVVAGGVVYAVVPVAAADPGRTLDLLREQLHGLVARLGATLGAEVVAGIGSHAAGVAEIVRSRATADEVLRVLRDEPQRGPVADLDEVRSVALLGRFTRMMAGDPLAAAGPLPTLQEHDARRHTGYVATLRAYLDAFGDVETVAAGLGVHANTVRYRLRQMQSLVGIDLRNPTDRLALMLQLQAQPVLEVAKPLVPADNRARRPAV
jgi:sugar diacid utilization regulator